ncbi:MAG TPA: hypothetical protein DDZ62_04320 [Delftia acidovorans]|nr:hypothetical protein [Delftia acidovorans]
MRAFPLSTCFAREGDDALAARRLLLGVPELGRVGFGRNTLRWHHSPSLGVLGRQNTKRKIAKKKIQKRAKIAETRFRPLRIGRRRGVPGADMAATWRPVNLPHIPSSKIHVPRCFPSAHRPRRPAGTPGPA